MRVMSIVVALLLGGCVTHHYTGERFAPSEEVRVFYGELPEGYRVIGRDRAEAIGQMSTEAIVRSMAGKAREVGADAISITGVDTRIGPATRVPALDEDVAVDEYYATQEGEFRMRRSGRSGWRIEPYTVTHRDRIVTARFLKLDEE